MNNHMLISKFTTCKDRHRENSSDGKEYMRLVRKYTNARIAMLNKYSVEEFKKFHSEWEDFAGLLPLPEDDNFIFIVLNKMCVSSQGIYPKVKQKAKQWLKENGYRESID